MNRFVPILLAALVLVFSSLACAMQAPETSLENPRMAFDQNGEQVTSTYSPTDVFYAVAELNNAPQDTVVKAVWSAVYLPGVEEEANIPEQTIDIAEEQFTGTIYFQLSNDLDWPAGLYRVEMYLNNTPAHSLEFSVE